MGEIALRPNKPPNGVSNAEATVRACALTTMVSAAQLRSTVARNAFHVRGTASVRAPSAMATSALSAQYRSHSAALNGPTSC
jgi:hypothetical protein